MRPIIFVVLAFLVSGLACGCSRTQTETFAKKATRERVFSSIEKVAVMPFDTLVEGPVGPKNSENILIQEILTNGTFKNGVEEPRYVKSLMKKFKLRDTTELEREVVQKIGQELNVGAILVGSLVLYGEEEKSKNVEYSISINMLDTKSGDILWSSRTFVRSATTWAEVFGLSDAPSMNDLAAEGIITLSRELDDSVVSARNIENEMALAEALPDDEEEGIIEEGDKSKTEEGQVEELLLKVKPQ